jgi:hydroxymethylglutaryl-CoA synthase
LWTSKRTGSEASMTAGIVAWGTYLPHYRLERKRIAATLGGSAATGTRTVASYDEDTTTMGVEAARVALSEKDFRPKTLLFSSPAPAYLDKTNATAVHAALGLPTTCGAFDVCGSVRSSWAAMSSAAAFGRGDLALVVMSDMRTGLPASVDEHDGGDGAAAYMWGPADAVAELVSTASTSAEFLDRWRLPTETTSHLWDERFGEQVYVRLAAQALTDALAQAGIVAQDLDYLIVAGLHGRAVRSLIRTSGVAPDAVVGGLLADIGNVGAAHTGILLAQVLDHAPAGANVAVVQLADGADAAVLRTTEALPAVQAGRRSPVRAQIESGSTDLDYADFLTWRGYLIREPPRRPDPEVPSAPFASRSQAWKFGFVAGRCTNCGTRHLPPVRVCLSCRAIDQMDRDNMADAQGTVTTFTVDRLAFSLAPPVVAIVVDFDGGGRFACEMTDADARDLAVGDRVEMTFRRLFTSGGVHNYFWKARPVTQP